MHDHLSPSERGSEHRWSTRLVDILRVLASTLTIQFWWRYASNINQVASWKVPIFLFRAFAVIFFSNVAVGICAAGVFPKWFAITSWISWFIVCGTASSNVILRSLRNLSRYLVLGIARPIWWFEWSRIAWHIFAFTAISCPVYIMLGKDLPAVLQFLEPRSVAYFAVSRLFPTFFVLSVLGYLVSMLTGLPRCGRAYECVNYYFNFFSGIVLTVTALAYWPPAKLWPNAVILVLSVVSGLTFCALFIVHLFRVMNRKPVDEQLDVL